MGLNCAFRLKDNSGFFITTYYISRLLQLLGLMLTWLSRVRGNKMLNLKQSIASIGL